MNSVCYFTRFLSPFAIAKHNKVFFCKKKKKENIFSHVLDRYDVIIEAGKNVGIIERRETVVFTSKISHDFSSFGNIF